MSNEIALYSFQVTEDPIFIPQLDTELILAYSGNSIEVQKEDEAYSFLSLVADVGGVLGLFICRIQLSHDLGLDNQCFDSCTKSDKS